VRFFSSAAGLLFAFGWWLFIDSAVYVSSQNDSMVVPPQLFLLGVAASLSLLIIVCIDISVIREDEFTYHGDAKEFYQLRAIFWFALLLLLFCLICSIYVLVHIYSHHNGIHGKIPDRVYPGVALFIQNCCIFVATWLLRYARSEED